ncbi:MAG: hypothetical protein ABJB85_05150 [Nitrososphaerota archaeon]
MLLGDLGIESPIKDLPPNLEPIIGNISKKFDTPHVRHNPNRFVVVVYIHVPDNDPIR